MKVESTPVARQSRGAERVFAHVMEPFLPGCAGVLMAEGLASRQRELFATRLRDGASAEPGLGAAAPDARFTLPILRRTDACVTVDIPAGPMGVFALSVSADQDLRHATLVNRPRLDWLYPAVVTPGNPVRLFGRNLVSAEHYPTLDPDHPVSFGGLLTGLTRVMARPADGGAFTTLPVTGSSAYEAHLQIPAGLAPGAYDLFAHNGHGGAAGWSDPLRVSLSPPDPWPATVFRVDDYLAPGQSTCHTNWTFSGNFTETCEHYADDAIAAALSAAERNGGGIVELSGRIYDISRTIVVPRRVVFRGQGADATWIRTPLGRGPRPPYVVITGEGDFTVEDLRILAFYAPVVINAPTWIPADFAAAVGRPHMRLKGDERRASNVTIRRCRIVQRMTAAKNRRLSTPLCPPEERAFLERLDEFYRAGADNCMPRIIMCGIHLRGDRMAVEECTILAAMHAVELAGTRSARVAGNVLKAGNAGNCLQMFGENRAENVVDLDIRGDHLREILIEDNQMTGHEGRARNGFFFYQSGSCCHVARNRIFDLSRDGDGEAMGTHLWMNRWSGIRLRMTEPARGILTARGEQALPRQLADMALEIVDGPGAGQVRTITRCDGDGVELDHPWMFPPADDSAIVLVAPPPFCKLVFVDNHVENTGANIIIWGSSNDLVIDGNHTADGSGIGTWSVYRNFAGEIWGGAMFTQIVNNTLDVGAFLPDEKAFREATVDSLSGHGVITTIMSKAGPTPGYDFLGLVVRNNCLRHNSAIYYRRSFPAATARGEMQTMRDAGAVIERNYSRDSEYGIVVEKGPALIARRNSAIRVRQPSVLLDQAADRLLVADDSGEPIVEKDTP